MGCNDIKCKKKHYYKCKFKFKQIFETMLFSRIQIKVQNKKILQFDRFKAKETHFLVLYKFWFFTIARPIFDIFEKFFNSGFHAEFFTFKNLILTYTNVFFPLSSLNLIWFVKNFKFALKFIEEYNFASAEWFQKNFTKLNTPKW